MMALADLAAPGSASPPSREYLWKYLLQATMAAPAKSRGVSKVAVRHVARRAGAGLPWAGAPPGAALRTSLEAIVEKIDLLSVVSEVSFPPPEPLLFLSLNHRPLTL